MRHLFAFFAGIAAAYGIASLAGRRISEAVQEMATVDLNTCSRVSLTALGLTEEEADKIIDARPYRNKLDLVSQFIIPEQDYVLIKQHVGVNLAKARDAVRVAG